MVYRGGVCELFGQINCGLLCLLGRVNEKGRGTEDRLTGGSIACEGGQGEKRGLLATPGEWSSREAQRGGARSARTAAGGGPRRGRRDR